MKRIVIIGGTGGIGKDITPILSHKLDELNQPKYIVMSYSSKSFNLVDSPVDIRTKIEMTEPDMLINLSTVSIDSTLHKLSEEDLDKQLSVNIRGSSILVNQLADFYRFKKSGKYIYISSILSDSPVPGAGIYSACKAYNDNLVRTAALENAKIPGVTFNSIQLGYFGSGLCERLSPEMKEYALKTIPVKRFGNPKELVDLIELIINNDYITGQNIKLAGGL